MEKNGAEGRSGKKERNRRPIVTVRLGKTFHYGGYDWVCPAIYLHGGILYLDICRKIEWGQFLTHLAQSSDGDLEHRDGEELMQEELENPMNFMVNFHLEINGRKLSGKGWQGNCWHPATGETDRDEAYPASVPIFPICGKSGRDPRPSSLEAWMNEYGLDPKSAWHFYRAEFIWPDGAGLGFEPARSTRAARREGEPGEINRDGGNLSGLSTIFLTLEATPVMHPCRKRFTCLPGCEPGDIRFTHPITEKPYVLHLSACEPEIMKVQPDFSRIAKKFIWPEHYCQMRYSVEPDLPDWESVRIMDCADSDSPLCLHGGKKSVSSCAVGVIAGIDESGEPNAGEETEEDGPTAFFFAGRARAGENAEPQMEIACSSLHFKPVSEVEWMIALSIPLFEPGQFSLL